MPEPQANPRLAVILLAAGPSSRLGHPKQLVKVDGECLVRRSARIALDLKPDTLLVVSGHERERVIGELDGLDVKTVYNSDWKMGMGGSIVAGARALDGTADGTLVMVCDQWKLRNEDLTHLVDAWRANPLRIYVARWNEGAALVSGPPVIFPGPLLRDLRSMDKHRGARQVIDLNMDIVEFVDVPSAAWDLDRPDDLARLQDGD